MYYTGILLLQDKNCYGFTKGTNPSALFKFRSFDGTIQGLVPTKIHTRTRRNQFCSVKRIELDENLQVSFIIHIHYGSVDDPIAFTKAMMFHNNLISKKTYFKKMPYHPIDFKKNNNIRVYTIDPPNCKDADDGISFHNDILGIHITYIGELMKPYLKELSNHCTIYPKIAKNIHMLPEKYATDDFSLKEGTWRNVISLYLKNKNIEWRLEKLKIKKNMTYEQSNILFKSQLDRFDKITDNYLKFVKEGNQNIDMKWIIQKCAILYNYFAASQLHNQHYIPIVREYHNKQDTLFSEAYYAYCNIGSKHDKLNITHYGHFTSPIRRSVDIYNQSLLKDMIMNIPEREENRKGLNMMKINESFRNAKRVMSACECYSMYDDNEIPNSIKGKILLVENDYYTIELIIKNKIKIMNVSKLPYYLETNWSINEDGNYEHTNGKEVIIKENTTLNFKILRDRDPYPRIMLVPEFLLALQKSPLNECQMIDIVELPHMIAGRW